MMPLPAALVLAAVQAGSPLTPEQDLARDVLKQLIEIDTTDASGNTTVAAEAMAARLRAAGFPEGDVRVLGPEPTKGNLVARLRGTGARKPVLLLAHLDVVEARREDWSVDPFTFTERDGYFYGRGTTDIKDGAAILVTNFILWKKQGFTPDRDLILALTAGEESGRFDGVEWLLEKHRDLIDAEYCINTDGGDFQMKGGKYRNTAIQASEKRSVSFRLEVRNRGGHSSLPLKENAIYRLAQGLVRLMPFDFPVHLNEVTRTFFERMAALEGGLLAADMRAVVQAEPAAGAAARLSASPYFNALLRTTCVATRLEAGHANNALPQSATAVVNCRILPGESPEDVRRTLVRVVDDEQIAISAAPDARSWPSSPLRADVLKALEAAAGSLWPGIPVVPTMETGGTDGTDLRLAGIPTYGVSGVFIDMDDVRAHGKDERVSSRSFYEGREFYDRFVRALASAPSP